MHKDGRSWRQLAAIIRQLPSHSRYVVAQRQDPEVAAYIAAQPEPKDKWAPPATEWSLMHELVTAGIDRLGELIVTTINVNAKDPIDSPDPFPRPRTEIDKARRRREQAEVDVEDDDLASVIFEAQAHWAEHGPPPEADDNN